jgi:response regulator of citrate/malate metabolism
MPLITLWSSSPEAVDQFTIEQVVATAGDGALKDNSVCSDELRRYLAQVPSAKIEAYIDHCLSSAFNKGGMVLQDLINELGRRLDYSVTNGRYQGTTNSIGFDGVWTSPDGHSIIVEVKTTDAYRISLDTIAGYRTRLEAAGQIGKAATMLIVVGRDDTGELEAQIRGSRHAWDIRLISADALVKLVRLKESSEEPETSGKIRSLLIPMEYTRLDAMIDVMFTTATDVEQASKLPEPDIDQSRESAEPEPSSSRQEKGVWEFTEPQLLQEKRNQIITALSRANAVSFIKKSASLYWDVAHEVRIACTLSKRYTKKGAYRYWYAYHPAWDTFLAEGKAGFFVLGCMDLSFAFAIPFSVLHPLLDSFNTTTVDTGKLYWHIHIVDTNGGFGLLLPKKGKNLDLRPYQIDL